MQKKHLTKIQHQFMIKKKSKKVSTEGMPQHSKSHI